MELYLSLSHGAEQERFAKELTSRCNDIWHGGHRQCEAVSLTGRPCLKPVKTNNQSAQVRARFTQRVEFMDCCCEQARCLHDSGCLIVSASRTGDSLKKRSDPFSFLDANVAFYGDCSAEEQASQPPANKATFRSKSKQRAPASSKHSGSTSKGEKTKSTAATELDMIVSFVDKFGKIDSSRYAALCYILIAVCVPRESKTGFGTWLVFVDNFELG